MAWVVTVSIDPDKSAITPSVGSATAVFTDTDGSVFTYSQRATFTLANATAFVTAAIAARDTWRAIKTKETTALTTLVSDFTAAGETATAGPVA